MIAWQLFNDTLAQATGAGLSTVRLDVTWIHSYVSNDKKKSFCVYDAPSPEAIRSTAKANGLPVNRITEVRVLDPYFYLQESL